MDRESHLRIPGQMFDALRHALTFADTVSHMCDYRMVKSELAIATIRNVYTLVSNAFAWALALFAEGQIDIEAFRNFKIEYLLPRDRRQPS